MMTSLAFIAGMVPLVIATGAGRATIRAVGTAVFGGMVAASFLGIFVIPYRRIYPISRDVLRGVAKYRAEAISDNPVYLAQREYFDKGLRLAGVPEG